MKNRYLILLAGLLVAGSMLLVACGDKNDKPADTKAPTVAQTDPATDPAEDTSAPAEDTSAPTEDNTTAPAEDDTTAPTEDSTTAPAEDSTTAPAEDNTTAPAEDNTTVPSEDTTEPDVVLPYEYWQDARYYVPHVAFDEIKANGTNIKPAEFDKAVAIEVSNTVSALYLWGWAAVMAEPYEFGYVIDDGEIIMNSEFTVEAEQNVVDAIANVGGLTGNRFAIAVDVAALEGAHNIKALVQLDGQYIIIAECNINKDGVTDTEETQPDANPDNVYEVDISTLADQGGYKANFAAAGYTKPLFQLGYGNNIYLGEMDLSKYSSVRIQYGCDGGAGTEANFAALNGDTPIGLKSTNDYYGNSGEYNMEGDIAHADMVFSSNGWASGARWIEIDLTGVDYNGEVYVAVHNPKGTGIAISAIEFILAEAQA